jgi:molybdenum cofactor guanylyltransferase
MNSGGIGITLLKLFMSQPNENHLSAIVLAGGLSTRMGQDKALISLDGETFIQRVCQIASQCTDIVYVVTPWVERYQAQVGVPIHWIKEMPDSDLVPSRTPLQAFAQGFAQIRTDWVLLLACDLPKLRADILQTWAQELYSSKTQAIARLPKNTQGWWEPLCGFYHRSCLESLDQFIAEGGRSFQRWLDSQVVQELPLTDSSILFNCNTIRDLEKINSEH